MKQKTRLSKPVLILILLMIFPLLFVLIYIIFPPTYVGYQLTFVSCKDVTRTFEYGSCQVDYIDVIDDGHCKPCGGIVLPCIRGFETHKRIDILTCLCSNSDFSSVKSFTNAYLNYSWYGFTNMSSQEMCANIPEKIRYR